MQRPCQAPRPLPPLRTPPPAPVLTWNRPNAATESARWRGRIAKLLTDGHLQACSQTKAGLPRFQTAAAQTTPTRRQTSMGFGKRPQEFRPRRPDLRRRRPVFRWRKLEFGWQQGVKKDSKVVKPARTRRARPGREKSRSIVARLRF